MLTPVFHVSQDEEWVLVHMAVHHVRTEDMDFFVGEREFKFHCTPYFLSLHFDGDLDATGGRERSEYDPITGNLTVYLPKAETGHIFGDLDMLTKLLTQPKAKSPPKRDKFRAPPLIEVIDKEDRDAIGEDGNMDAIESSSQDEGDDRWIFPQDIRSESLLGQGGAYGFNNKYKGIFADLTGEMGDLLQIQDPENLSEDERSAARIAQDDAHFDEEHFCADTFDEDGCIAEVIAFKPWWQAHSAEGHLPPEAHLDNEDREEMRRLACRSLLISKGSTASLLHAVTGILFAYCYDVRTTLGESTVESGWTLCVLSPQLGWLDNKFSDPADVCSACMRRALSFPLYRSLVLAEHVLRDVIHIFDLGRRGLLKGLLHTRRILGQSEKRYILNRVWTDDLCAWIQTGLKNKYVEAYATLLHEIPRPFPSADISVEWDIDGLHNLAQQRPPDLPT